MHVLEILSDRYPQLRLPVRTGMHDTELYKNVVLRGEKISDHENAFSMDPRDQLYTCNTPVGAIDALQLHRREDFEHAYQALAYRCEPVEILPSVGAGIIRGLINWQKIRSHKAAYLAAGHLDWSAEFKRFTADKSNYLDALILLSSGPYSDIPAERLHLSENEWRSKSVQIRMYHELTHFICLKIAPEKKDALRDEIYADCIGLIAAFGKYDTYWAKLFLGIEGDEFREGGRLEHYADGNVTDHIPRAHSLIHEAAEGVAQNWR